ncbi:hypothetical protein ACNOYE_15030 [Nannocystaceae bacterium ST9]
MSVPPTFLHCPFWCEENVWHLCEHELVAGRERHVLIVSNEIRRVAMWAQRAARHPMVPIGWDYHVALLVRGDRGWEIWDLDSTLGLPVPATAWLDCSFLAPDSALAPVFRVVAADRYRREFASDRSHMLEDDGSYRQPPPSWPAIGRASNLARFVDMDDRFVGEIMDLAELRAWLGR